MALYTAFLRGINVGGHNKLPMAELRKVLQEAGLSRVQTVIQSGNIVFESPDSAQSLQSQLEQCIQESFGLTVPVVIRTADQLAAIMNHKPFTAPMIEQSELADVEVLYVALLIQPIPSDGAADIRSQAANGEQIWFLDDNVYLYLPQGIRNSKLASRFQNQLPATIRNWKTMTKMASLVGVL